MARDDEIDMEFASAPASRAEVFLIMGKVQNLISLNTMAIVDILADDRSRVIETMRKISELNKELNALIDRLITGAADEW